MTQEQIIEGNTFLAEFMEYEHDELEDDDVTITYNCYDHLENISGKKPWKSTIDDYTSWLRPDEMKFHSSWDWLMSVVDKIESIIFDENNSFNVTIGSTIYCVIQDTNGECYDMVYDGEESKLLVVYKAVVEFIKWYNENN